MSAGGAAVAAMVRAVKASGAIVQVRPAEFLQIVQKNSGALVITSGGWAFGKRYKYLTSYKGLAFYASSGEPLQLPGNAEVIPASSMWMPG